MNLEKLKQTCRDSYGKKEIFQGVEVEVFDEMNGREYEAAALMFFEKLVDIAIAAKAFVHAEDNEGPLRSALAIDDIRTALASLEDP